MKSVWRPLDGFWQQKSPCAFAIYKIFTECKESIWHWNTSTQISFVFWLFWPPLEWNIFYPIYSILFSGTKTNEKISVQDHHNLISSLQLHSFGGTDSSSLMSHGIDPIVFLMLGRNSKALTKEKSRQNSYSFFVEVWSFVSGLLGLALFCLSEGLRTDKEAHTKHLQLNGTVITMLFWCEYGMQTWYFPHKAVEFLY